MKKCLGIEEWIIRNLTFRKRAFISERVVERYGGTDQMLKLLEDEGYHCIMKKVQRKSFETMMSEQFYNIEMV